MQNIPSTATKNKRLERINSLKTSMKQIPLLSKKTIQMEGKFLSKNDSENSMEKSSKTEDTRSNNSDTPSSSQNSQLDAFMQKYELLEKIGQGANACVYKCRHKKSGKIYAAKKLKVQQEHILELKRNFISFKQLRHPSIIKYKGLYLDSSLHSAFLVMECFDKPNLSECQINTEEQLKSITKKIVQALQYLHQKNICHRDVKPENILYCTKSKEIKIIDFGISKKTFQKGSRRDMLTMIGTQFYQAPEIFIGGGYDQRVDIWALGVTIFKLVTGYTPFESQYHSSTVQKIIKGEASFEDRAWSKYSTFLKDFVNRLLKKKKERMTLRDALNHIWLNEAVRLKRSISQALLLHQDFHDEINYNLINALSREEGTKLIRKQKPRKVNLLNRTFFESTDTQDELQELAAGDGQQKIILI